MTIDDWKAWVVVHGETDIGGGWVHMLFSKKKSKDQANADEEHDVDPMDVGRVVDLGPTLEAGGSRAAGRRRGREEPVPFGNTFAPSLPYTYDPFTGPHTLFYPNVPWPTPAYLDDGLESRVPPEHYGLVSLRVQNYNTCLLDSLHSYLGTGFRLDFTAAAATGSGDDTTAEAQDPTDPTD